MIVFDRYRSRERDMVLLTAEQQRAFDATLRKRSQLEAARRDGSGSKRDAFEQKWTDGHGVRHSRASGRGKKGDETMRVLSVIDESPVFALDEGDPITTRPRSRFRFARWMVMGSLT